MFENFLNMLKYESELLELLINLAMRQQRALIKYDTTELMQVVVEQEQIMKTFRETEENRIRFMMQWLNVQRKDVINIKLSSLEKFLEAADLNNIRQFRGKIAEQMNDLNNINTLNRVLANRARFNVQQILSLFTNGSNYVCNVKI